MQGWRQWQNPLKVKTSLKTHIVRIVIIPYFTNLDIPTHYKKYKWIHKEFMKVSRQSNVGWFQIRKSLCRENWVFIGVSQLGGMWPAGTRLRLRDPVGPCVGPCVSRFGNAPWRLSSICLYHKWWNVSTKSRSMRRELLLRIGDPVRPNVLSWSCLQFTC